MSSSILIDIGVYAALAIGGLAAGWLLRGWRSGSGRDGSGRSTAERFEAAMHGWQRITHALEGALLDNLAATTPYLATFIPAVIAYGHTHAYLGFNRFEALVAAAVVEFLGLAAVHTAFQLWEWNETKGVNDEAAPLWWAVAAGGVYLLVVVVTNVLLEAAGVQAWTGAAVARIAAKALLSLLSVVAAFVLALRAQHARRQAAKQERNTVRSQAVELGQLRKKVAALETAVAERDTKVAALETERTALEREVAGLKRAARALEQERDTLKRMETELAAARNTLVSEQAARNTLEAAWNRLPGDMRAAAVYVTHGGTMRDLAEQYSTSPASISRAKKEYFGENGNGP